LCVRNTRTACSLSRAFGSLSNVLDHAISKVHKVAMTLRFLGRLVIGFSSVVMLSVIAGRTHI